MVNLRNFIATVHITARPHPHTSFSSDDPIHIIKCLHSCIYAPSSDCPRPSLYLTPIFSSPPSRHLPFNPADTVTGNIHHVKMPCPSCHLSAYHASAPPGGVNRLPWQTHSLLRVPVLHTDIISGLPWTLPHLITVLLPPLHHHHIRTHTYSTLSLINCSSFNPPAPPPHPSRPLLPLPQEITSSSRWTHPRLRSQMEALAVRKPERVWESVCVPVCVFSLI